MGSTVRLRVNRSRDRHRHSSYHRKFVIASDTSGPSASASKFSRLASCHSQPLFFPLSPRKLQFNAALPRTSTRFGHLWARDRSMRLVRSHVLRSLLVCRGRHMSARVINIASVCLLPFLLFSLSARPHSGCPCRGIT